MLEICQNADGSTDLATDRRGHDGLSWTPSSHTCAISSAALFITSTASMTDRHRHDDPSRVSFQNTSTLGIWVLDYFSELPDEPAGRTVVDTTDRHGLRNPTLGQNSLSSFSSYTTMPPMDHHEHDEPSQAR